MDGLYDRELSLEPACEFFVPVGLTPFKPFLFWEKGHATTLVVIMRLGFQSLFVTEIETSSFHQLFFLSFLPSLTGQPPTLPMVG